MHADRRPRRLARKRFLSSTRYGAAYRTTKDQLRAFVAAGLADCVRCGEPIAAGAPWDLGHDDVTHEISGPEHPTCNRGAPNRNITSRQW